jgi:hypothetical protein
MQIDFIHNYKIKDCKTFFNLSRNNIITKIIFFINNKF